jgi:SAM-dependent methyltransferase
LRLAQLADLRTLDRNAGPGIDIVADVHDAGSVAPESLDVVLLFNVLEHCVDPAVVVDNIHGWLREGGRCFCMVPNAQRQHDAPSDYWRFSPAGLEHLFRSWSATSVRTYGSLTTVLGSYAGVAAEELDPEELARHDPAYPVATCLAATR